MKKKEINKKLFIAEKPTGVLYMGAPLQGYDIKFKDMQVVDTRFSDIPHAGMLKEVYMGKKDGQDLRRERRAAKKLAAKKKK